MLEEKEGAGDNPLTPAPLFSFRPLGPFSRYPKNPIEGTGSTEHCACQRPSADRSFVSILPKIFENDSFIAFDKPAGIPVGRTSQAAKASQPQVMEWDG
jgi:23S rRNA-/tRNA-specific pseudouridylate synthase